MHNKFILVFLGAVVGVRIAYDLGILRKLFLIAIIVIIGGAILWPFYMASAGLADALERPKLAVWIFGGILYLLFKDFKWSR